MANKKYACVRTDNMMGTKVGSHLVSLRYPAEIENGNILAVKNLEEDSREVYEADVPGAATPLKELALIASEEIVKDVKSHDIFDFINLAGTVSRGYKFASNDIFSVTPEALTADSATPAVGQYACVKSSTKIKLAAAADGTTIGKVIAIELESNGNEWVVIQVQ